MDLRSFSKKQKIIIIASTILILAIPLTAYLAKQTQIFKPRAEEVTTLSPPTTETPNDHPDLYYFYLEYNQAINSVTELGSGRTKGDIPFLKPSPIPASTDEFIYKVELISENNEPLQKGWVSVPRGIIVSQNNQLRFHVYILYKPRAIVQVSLPDGSIIWTGQIP